MDTSMILAVLSGIAIAAACGLRAFLPLLLLGLAGRFELIPLKSDVAWLSGNHALIALALATALEIAADKIPVVDHALDTVSTVIRPAAGWLGAYAVLASWPAPWSQIAAVVLGSTALGVHSIKSGLRLGSSAATLGTANPLLSFAEDGLAVGLVAAAVLAPILVLGLAAIWLLRRGTRKRARAKA